MTQDYKDTLLRYLTGNLQQQSGSNVPQLGNPISSATTIGYELRGYNVIDIISGYESPYCAIYGNDNNGKGFIAVIDENYNLLQIITEYITGTDFGTFQVLNIDEEGKFYGIDINNGTPRFIMLNNFLLKAPNQNEFSVKLRQSYNLPSPLSTATKYFAITKAVGQGKYLMGAETTSSSVNSPLVTELTINVGSTNDWIDYSYTETTDSFNGQSIWASWNQDVLDFKICGYAAKTSNPYYVEYTLNGSSLDKNEIMIATPLGYADNHYEITTILQNKQISYVGVFGGSSGGTQDISVYISKGNNQLTYVTGQFGGTTGYVNSPKRIQLKTIGDTTYYLWKIYSTTAIGELYINIGRLTYIPSTGSVRVGHKTITARGDTFEYYFYVSNNFNLYNYNVLGFDFSSSTVGSNNYLAQEVYNTNNYNGLAYENINSLVPNNGILYDSNDLILFARNLYNMSVYGNTTLSVLQIPNTMVNDVTISTQNLLGETNKILVSNTDNFTKNIYETLFINFYNHITIQNQNTLDYISNPTGSAALNLSVSSNNDYSNKKATKCRINYSDNTTKIFTVQPTITSGVATCDFNVYVNKTINTIDIISQDETTVYQTINNLNTLQINKIYKITQDCYVE